MRFRLWAFFKLDLEDQIVEKSTSDENKELHWRSKRWLNVSAIDFGTQTSGYFWYYPPCHARVAHAHVHVWSLRFGEV